jgi:PhnB protein
VKIDPSVTIGFNGDCDAAFAFYEQCLGGKRRMTMTWASSPMAKDAPAGWGDKVLYAEIIVGGVELAGGDMTPEQYKAPTGISIMLRISDVADAERVFKELSNGGKIQMPMSETFWALRYGGVTDKFGVPWQINCPKPA